MQHWKKTQGFKVFCGFLSSSHSWMKDPPWVFSNRGMFHCYVSLLEGTHNFWKLQENYNLDSTLQGILMYWPMHVLRQQQFLPLLGHLHSHLMVKLWWWNCGATGAVMGFIQIGFCWESAWCLAKLPRAFESWVLVSVLLQETIRPEWVRTAKKSFSVETCGIDMFSRTFRTIEHQLSLITE